MNIEEPLRAEKVWFARGKDDVTMSFSLHDGKVLRVLVSDSEFEAFRKLLKPKTRVTSHPAGHQPR